MEIKKVKKAAGVSTLMLASVGAAEAVAQSIEVNGQSLSSVNDVAAVSVDAANNLTVSLPGGQTIVVPSGSWAIETANGIVASATTAAPGTVFLTPQIIAANGLVASVALPALGGGLAVGAGALGAVALAGDSEPSTSPSIPGNQTFGIDENNSANAVVGTVSASDSNGTVDAFAILSGDSNGDFAIDANGQITAVNVLDHEATDSYSLTVEATDNDGETSTSTITINVGDVDDTNPAITASQTLNVDENSANGTVVGTVAANDPGDDSTGVSSFAITAGDTNGAFAIDNNGQITVADVNELDFETTTSYSLTVQATDGAGNTTTETVTVNINNVDETDPTITANQSFAIDENSANGTAVGTVAATDPGADSTGVSSFAITAGDTNGAFAIDANGAITVADVTELDFETTTSYSLTVQATDGAGNTTTETVTVNVNDVDDTDPAITASQSFAIDENSANGTAVGTVAATDPGADSTGVASFAITAGDTNGAFAIDSNGAITVADVTELDFETTTSYSLTVQATDGAGNTTTETVTVNVNDVDDTDPVITASQSFNVAENTPNSTVLGTVAANDPGADSTGVASFTITAGNTDGIFAIDNNGQVTVSDNSNLDFDTTTSYSLTVQVTDGAGNTGTQTVTINVSDVDDTDPVITANQTFAVDENSANNTVVGSVAATDPGSDSTGVSSFAITAGDTNGAFAIDNNGQITVADVNELDFETTTSYSLTVQATDGAGNTTTETVTVNINNVDETDPTITANQSFAIDENSANGTAVGTVAATDPGADSTGVSSFAITAGDANGAFAIDANGAITVADVTELDFETTTSYSLTVQATDGAGNTTTETVTVNINNVDETDPTITANQSFAIDENSANGTAVGTVAATDPGADSTGVSSFAITAGDANGAFAIDANGAITVADVTELDFETTTSHSLTVQATDGAGNTTTETVTVNVNDVDDTDPAITASQSFAIDENSANGTAVGAVAATDPGADSTGVSSFAITAGDTNGAFAIDSNGAITVADTTELDFETTTSYSLTVQATDGAGNTTTETVTVNVNDVDDTAPDILAGQTFFVDEFTQNGVEVGTVSAADSGADATGVASFAITAGNTGSAFAIDNDGVITVADASAIDYEATSSYSLTVQATDGGGNTTTATVVVNVDDFFEISTTPIDSGPLPVILPDYFIGTGDVDGDSDVDFIYFGTDGTDSFAVVFDTLDDLVNDQNSLGSVAFPGQGSGFTGGWGYDDGASELVFFSAASGNGTVSFALNQTGTGDYTYHLENAGGNLGLFIDGQTVTADFMTHADMGYTFDENDNFGTIDGDGDGDFDIWLFDISANEFLVFENEGTPTNADYNPTNLAPGTSFASIDVASLIPAGETLVQVGFFDLTNDGIEELLIGTNQSYAVYEFV